jgi:hypothetical protein
MQRQGGMRKGEQGRAKQNRGLIPKSPRNHAGGKAYSTPGARGMEWSQRSLSYRTRISQRRKGRAQPQHENPRTDVREPHPLLRTEVRYFLESGPQCFQQSNWVFVMAG